MENALGFQTTIDFYGCDTNKINSKEFIEEVLVDAAKKMNLTVVKTTIHSFSPIGVSGVIVIKESHLAILPLLVFSTNNEKPILPLQSIFL